MALSTLDFIVILSYLILTLYIGLRLVKRENLEGYLVNNRKSKFTLLTLSNIATLVGAGAVVTVASTAYSSGISYGLSNIFALIVVGLVYALISPRIKKFGDKHKAHTLGDFFLVRFGSKTRYVFAFFYFFIALLWGALQFVAIAQLFNVLIGVNFIIALIGAVLVTLIYTSLAGIISDMMTDALQFIVMALTFIILLPMALNKAGGISALTNLPSTYFDPLAFGGIAFFIGGIILGGLVLLPSVHYWQRIYSAESTKTVRRSFLWSIPGMLFFVLASIIAGLLAISIVPGVPADSALFELMKTTLPSGLLGFAFAGILAVVMSSVDSLLIGSSATFLKDIYMPLKKIKIKEKHLLKKARVFTIILGLLMALLAFLIPSVVNLSLLVSFTALCFVPAILGGLFWKKASARGAVISMLSSLVVLYLAYPFLPKVAFLPSFLVGIITLIMFSSSNKN